MSPSSTTPSFVKFNYSLRPSKQVERKLIIECLQRMAQGGFKISDYTYLGLGSVYYADFILFHKYLYIDKMICSEAEPIPKRMKFNKPFGFVRLEMKRVAEVLPTLNRARPYFVWLDYDFGLNAEILADISSSLYILAPGSILVITVDAEPRLPRDLDDPELTATRRQDRILRFLRSELGRYSRDQITRRVLTPTGYPLFLAQILRNHIQEETTRRGFSFVQLFNYKYADRAQMLSLGGVLCDEETRDKIQRAGVLGLDFVEQGEQPLEISVPPLTVREKQWLDARIARVKKPTDVVFEIDQAFLNNFRRYYRHYPTYYETLL